VLARERDAGAGGDGAAVWRCGDRDSAAAPELEQSLVSERAQRPQHCVGVDADHGGQVFGWWQALAWSGLAVGDGPADLGRDLLVQVDRGVLIDLDRSMMLVTLASLCVASNVDHDRSRAASSAGSP